MSGEIVTIILNQRSEQVIDTMTKLLGKLVERYRFSVSNLLVEAEKNDQPKRLALLKKIWFEGLQGKA